jgi:hypothetical protein
MFLQISCISRDIGLERWNSRAEADVLATVGISSLLDKSCSRERVLEVSRICYEVTDSSLQLAVMLQFHASSGKVTNYLIFPEDGGSMWYLSTKPQFVISHKPLKLNMANSDTSFHMYE